MGSFISYAGGVFSLTELTEASPPTPLRMERGVVCEVTPIRLLIKGDGLLGIQRTQNVIAIVDNNKEQNEAFILLIGVSR